MIFNRNKFENFINFTVINKMKYDIIINELLKSNEPTIVYKTFVNILGEDFPSKKIKILKNEIKNSARVKKLLSNRDNTGKIKNCKNVYDKWQGSHWIMILLAELDYPENDKTLLSTVDELLNFWLKDYYFNEVLIKKPSDVFKDKTGVPFINGKYRRCASQQGNLLYALLKLGFHDKRIHNLAELLLKWQWDDGGWNCDKNPDAKVSSFVHTLWSIRGLSYYNKFYPSKKIPSAIKNASEVILKRKLYKRLSDNSFIREEFIKLHYPLYWHYDILGALKVFSENGFITDNRCNDALDLLESKLIIDKGWASEGSYLIKGGLQKVHIIKPQKNFVIIVIM